MPVTHKNYYFNDRSPCIILWHARRDGKSKIKTKLGNLFKMRPILLWNRIIFFHFFSSLPPCEAIKSLRAKTGDWLFQKGLGENGSYGLSKNLWLLIPFDVHSFKFFLLWITKSFIFTLYIHMLSMIESYISCVSPRSLVQPCPSGLCQVKYYQDDKNISPGKGLILGLLLQK